MKEKNEFFFIFFFERERERGFYGGRGEGKGLGLFILIGFYKRMGVVERFYIVEMKDSIFVCDCSMLCCFVFVVLKSIYVLCFGSLIRKIVLGWGFMM